MADISTDSLHSGAALPPSQQLRVLMAHWQKEQPGRAMGGWWALAGFSFQTSLFLLRFFQDIGSLVVSPDSPPAMEALSDILCPSDGRFCLIQAKRTLTKGALVSALQEAYVITDLCLRKMERLLPHLRFQITCSKRSTSLAILDIDPAKLCEKGFDPQIYAAMIAQFDINEPIVVQRDPLPQLYLHLWNTGIADPAGLVRLCHGEMLESFGTEPTEHSHLAWRLNGYYENARRIIGWTSIGDVLTKYDVEPYPNAASRKDVLINDVPRLEHLRRGCVRDREAIFGPLLSDYLEWLSTIDDEDTKIPDRIPVFWISGRSGEGKSVLLLQLLAKWIETSPGSPVLHLKAGRKLVSLLDRPPSERVFAFVDDLYDVSNREEWSERVREACSLHVPPVAVVTCGPTEQMDICAHDLDGLFYVHAYKVPHFQDSERHEFAEWFQSRTGRRPDLEHTTTDNPLLVQLMFELDQGTSVSRFAVNFRKRLTALGMFEDVRSILAVNALYLDAPLAMLTSDHVRDGLAALSNETELHFRFTAAGESGNPIGIRLAHAHLAWLLFAEWVGPQSALSTAWARELARAMALIESATGHEHETHEILRSLLASAHVSKCEDRAACPPLADQRTLLHELYRCHIQGHGGQPTVSTLTRWLEYEYRIPDLLLLPDPLACAEAQIARPDTAVRVHGSVVRWLWLAAGMRPTREKARIRTSIKSFLQSYSNNPRAVPMLAFIISQTCDTGTVDFAIGWLREHGGHRQAFLVVIALLRTNPADPRVRELAFDWLGANGGHHQACQVVAACFASDKVTPELHGLTVAWLRAHLDHAHAHRFIVAVLQVDWLDTAARTLAIDWIRTNPEHVHAHRVLRSLARGGLSDPDVRNAVMEWLSNAPNQQQARQLLRTLVPVGSTDTETKDLMAGWLQREARTPRPYRLLKDLVGVQPQSGQVRQSAVEWFSANRAHVHAHRLLAELLSSDSTDIEVRGLAMEWMRTHSEHDDAHLLLLPLLSGNPSDNDLRTIVIDWLNKNGQHRLTYQLLAPLLAANPGNDEVRSIAIQWLDTNDEHEYAYHVLAPLLAANPGDTRVKNIALRWLRRDDTNLQASHIIPPLVAANADDSEVMSLATGWLRANRDHTGYAAVLSVVIARTHGSAEWLSTGKQYVNDKNSRDAHNVLAVLLTASKAAPAYVDFAHDWLESASNPKAVRWIMRNLSRALSSYPQNVLNYLEGQYRDDRKMQVCDELARGMLLYPDSAGEVMSLLPHMGHPYASLTLMGMVRNGIVSPEVDAAVATWLAENQGSECYKDMLQELSENPNLLDRLKAADLLP